MSPRNTKKRMEKMLGILTLVQKMKGKNMKYVAENLSDEAIEMLSECVFNSITGTIRDKKTRNTLRKRLLKDRDKFRFISKPSNELKKKRQMIPQMGRGLGLIASILIPLISTALNTGIQALGTSNQVSRKEEQASSDSSQNE